MYCHCNLSGMEFLDNALGFYMDHLAGGRGTFCCGISTDIYESASMDGANAFKRFIYITLPLMKPAMLSVLMLGFIYTFKAFDLMYIMTAGGPFNSTDVLGTYAYSKAFTQYEFSQGSAIAMVLFACLFLVGIFYLKLLSKEDD